MYKIRESIAMPITTTNKLDLYIERKFWIQRKRNFIKGTEDRLKNWQVSSEVSQYFDTKNDAKLYERVKQARKRVRDKWKGMKEKIASWEREFGVPYDLLMKMHLNGEIQNKGDVRKMMRFTYTVAEKLTALDFLEKIDNVKHNARIARRNNIEIHRDRKALAAKMKEVA